MPQFLPYISLLILAALISLYRWPILSRADRWVCLLLCATLLQESLAEYFKVQFKNNFITYHIYTPIELFIIALYFDQSMRFKHPYRVGISIGILGIILSIINTVYFQPIHTFNSYYLLFEGCIVVSLCLLSFYKLLIREDIITRRMSNFWLTMCFLFYWSLTYVNLGLFTVQIGRDDMLAKVFTWTLYLANLLFYFGLALVFLRYKKLIPSGE